VSATCQWLTHGNFLQIFCKKDDEERFAGFQGGSQGKYEKVNFPPSSAKVDVVIGLHD